MNTETETKEIETTKPTRKKWDDYVVAWWRKNKVAFSIVVFILLFLIVYLWNHIFIAIMPGETGVKWKRFDGGTVVERIYGEGLHVVFPLDKLYIYETRVQQRETTFMVLSKNGLAIKITASVRFRPTRESLPLLHKEIGPDYVERVVLPEVQAEIRRIIGEYTPDELYGSQDGILKNVVLTTLGEMSERFIELDDLLIKEIELPKEVAAAIEAKLRLEQEFLSYEYRLLREEKEAERKGIEAKGIALFQKTISSGITKEFLQFKGIEATLALATSPNAKVVVIGSGSDGMPLILNTADSNLSLPKPVINESSSDTKIDIPSDPVKK